jgi:hypothetical protein
MRFERDENGDGLPPPKSIVPAELENVGSVVQSENTEPVFETLETESFVLSKESFASTALTLFPCGFVWMVAVNDWPTEYVPVLGDTATSAARAKCAARKNNPVTMTSLNAVFAVVECTEGTNIRSKG